MGVAYSWAQLNCRLTDDTAVEGRQAVTAITLRCDQEHEVTVVITFTQRLRGLAVLPVFGTARSPYVNFGAESVGSRT